MRRFLPAVLFALALPGLALAKEPLTARVCGTSACRPVAAGTAWHLVPWYGLALAAPPAQPFFTVELRAGSERDSRVVWAPAAGLVWTDARLEAAGVWTRPARYLHSARARRDRASGAGSRAGGTVVPSRGPPERPERLRLVAPLRARTTGRARRPDGCCAAVLGSGADGAAACSRSDDCRHRAPSKPRG